MNDLFSILGLNCQILFHILFTICCKIWNELFHLSNETPIPIICITHICMNNKYVTQGVLGRSGETWPGMTGWVGQKRPFSAWRIYVMAPSKSVSIKFHLYWTIGQNWVARWSLISHKLLLGHGLQVSRPKLKYCSGATPVWRLDRSLIARLK